MKNKLQEIPDQSTGSNAWQMISLSAGRAELLTGNQRKIAIRADLFLHAIKVLKIGITYFLMNFSASFAGAVVQYATVSASLNIAFFTFFKFTNVKPILPQPPGTG